MTKRLCAAANGSGRHGSCFIAFARVAAGGVAEEEAGPFVCQHAPQAEALAGRGDFAERRRGVFEPAKRLLPLAFHAGLVHGGAFKMPR